MRFQELRTKLVQEARRLVEQMEVETAIGEVVGAEIAQGVLESRCTGKDPWSTFVESRDNGQAALVVQAGDVRREIYVGSQAQMEQAREGYEHVVGQISHPGRVEPVERAYGILVSNARAVEDLVDDLVLRGRPRGHCSMCPRPSPL